MFLVSETQSLV